jgi:hypothetical protein
MSARSIAYQATVVPAIASSPWNRSPHFSITRREAVLVAMVALMIRSNPTVSNPRRTPARPPSVASPRPQNAWCSSQPTSTLCGPGQSASSSRPIRPT